MVLGLTGEVRCGGWRIAGQVNTIYVAGRTIAAGIARRDLTIALL